MAGKSSHRAYRGPQSPKKQETIIKSVYPEFPKTKRMVSHPRHHLPPAQFPRTLAIHGHSRNDDRPVRRHPRPRRRRSRRIPLRPPVHPANRKNTIRIRNADLPLRNVYTAFYFRSYRRSNNPQQKKILHSQPQSAFPVQGFLPNRMHPAEWETGRRTFGSIYAFSGPHRERC